MPRISIILTSFNHEKYICEAIESVLNQSFSDFELIILDDASTDNSWTLINKYSDPRIRAFKNEINTYSVSGVNHAITEIASGEYIAIHHSDDVWELDKLAKQVAVLESDPKIGAVFTWTKIIDENGVDLKDLWFIKKNKSQWQWLFELFTENNYLAHPSVMIRKQCYIDVGVYDAGLAQTTDVEMWSRVLIKFPIYLIEEELTKHRLFSDQSNTSGKRLDVAIRTNNEWNVLRENYLSITNYEDIIATFPNLIRFENPEGFDNKFLLAMACLYECTQRSAWQLGLRWLSELLNDQSRSEKIKRLYSFTYKDFIKLTGKFDTYAVGLLADQDRQIANLHQSLIERDEYITRLSGSVVEHEKRISECDERISQLLASNSWKVTRPLREVQRWLSTPRAQTKRYFNLGADLTKSAIMHLPISHQKRLAILRQAHRVRYFRPIHSWLRVKAKLDTHTINSESWPKDIPLVSVVIPCFNYGKYINEAIDSVLNQTFQNFEIIVVDDESTDPYTQEVLAALDKPKTRLIRQKNQRVSMARNNGIREARGKYICCLDADDLLAPTYIEKCLYWLESRNLDICYSWYQLFGDSNLLFRGGPFTIDALMDGNPVATTALFRKTVWDKVGGYKAEMRHGYEDWEFWLSLAEHGARGDCIPEPLFLYRKHGPSLTTETDLIHTRLCNDIRQFHHALYSDKQLVARIRKQQFKNYIVKEPFANLLARIEQEPLPSTLNILLCVPWFDLGGNSVLMSEVFTHLTPNKVKVTAIATNPAPDATVDEGLSLYESFTKDCFNLPRFLSEEQYISFVEYLIQSRKIDIVFLAGSRLIYENLPRLKDRFATLKIVDQLYNTVGHVTSNREFKSYIDINLVANEEVRDYLIQQGESPERIQVIPHGIDTVEFAPTNSRYRTHLKNRIEQRFTFGFMGRLNSEKRPQDIISLAAKMPLCCFRICGDGPMAQELHKKVLTQGLSERVYFEGRYDQPVEFFANIDALVVSSEIEGLPLVLLEAMALKLPVIATKVGRIPLAIQHANNGFLYDIGKVDQLADLANHLMKMSEQGRKDIGENARKTVLNEYDIVMCSTRYGDIFQGLKTTGEPQDQFSKQNTLTKL